MARQIDDNEAASLNRFYSRITRVAKGMGGVASRIVQQRSITVAVATPRRQIVPALLTDIPGGFQVDFAPPDPIITGTVLRVRARRVLSGQRKNDWTFIFGPDGWRTSQGLLSDEEIRACLTPDRAA